MRYDRTEMLTLVGLLLLLVAGIVLVVPQVAGGTRLSMLEGLSPNRADNDAALDLALDNETNIPADSRTGMVPSSSREEPSPNAPASTPPNLLTDLLGGKRGEPGEPVTVKDSPQSPENGGGGPGAGESTVVYVQLAGAVVSPGVITVPQGTRLFQALERAGGTVNGAAVDVINLAVPVVDGQLIYIPTYEELKTGQTSDGLPAERLIGCGIPVGGVQSGATLPGSGTSVTAQAVNLNTADYDKLLTVPGIGPTLARRILTYRADNGGFGAVDELVNVTGIGEATLRELRQYFSVH